MTEETTTNKRAIAEKETIEKQRIVKKRKRRS